MRNARNNAVRPFRTLANKCQRGFIHSRYAYKELASVPEAAWKAGQRRRSGLPGESTNLDKQNNESAPEHRTCRNEGPFRGNSQAVYCDHNSQSDGCLPHIVPPNSELHTAYITQPLSRSGIRFNPWSLVLEVLDDPRLLCTLDSDNKRRLLLAIGRLGWVTPDNILAQRSLFVRHLLQTQCFARRPDSRQDCADYKISSAQLMSLSQMQWPRYIADKYERLVSVPSIEHLGHSELLVKWCHAWLATSICMLELRAAYTKRRVLFNSRMDTRTQTKHLIRSAFEHAPGLALNAIMCWRGNFKDILNPHFENRLYDRYFTDTSTFKSVIIQAWQLYDRLIHNNPCQPTPEFMRTPSSLSLHSVARLVAHNPPSLLLFRALCAFDNSREATQALSQLHQEYNVKVDKSIVERFMLRQRASRLIRRPPSTNI
ncbi:hypothetical protein H4S08_001592 [Coemansia sp. RSA 1365]|nr:hypothetical protein H4S08_001592 [Coemansia sp. RSA 1365]